MIFSGETIKIRRAVKDDARDIAALAARAFRETYAPVFPKRDVDAYIARRLGPGRQAKSLVHPHDLTLIANDGEIACGYTTLRFNSTSGLLPNRHQVELVEFYLLTDWVGQGIGSFLMKTALQYALLHGAQTCWRRVWIQDRQAIAFHRRWHFTEAGCGEYPIGRSHATSLILTRSV